MNGRRRTGLSLAVAMAVLGAGCSAASVPPSAAATPGTVATATLGPTGTVATIAPKATGTPPAGGPVPATLAGTWLGKSDTIPPGVEQLTLNGGSYTLTSSDGTSKGQVVVNGSEIDFFEADQCRLHLPNGIGRYTWTVSAGVLHLAPLGVDPCGRVAVLSDADYHR